MHNSSISAKCQAGFSLVELLAVVGIVSVLAAIVTPKLQMFVAKARQSEARTLMKQINISHQSFYAENSRYSNDMALIGFDSGCAFESARECNGSECRVYACRYKHYPNITLALITDMSVVDSWFHSVAYKSLCPGVHNDAWVATSRAPESYANCAFVGNEPFCFTDNQSAWGDYPAGNTTKLCR